MRRLLAALAAWLTVLMAAAAEERPSAGAFVTVVNWSDYIDPSVLDDFTNETGIRVVYDTYDSSETLQAKLEGGKNGYDVVVTSGLLLQRDIKAGFYQKLDWSRLPHARGLSPEVMAKLAAADPGNQYAANYLWFTAGLAYDAKKTAERLGGTSPAVAFSTWDSFFRPEFLRRFADCGVAIPRDPEEFFALALNYLKLDPESHTASDLARGADVHARIKSLLKKNVSGDTAGALARGELCLTIAWAGDAAQARARAASSVHIDYAVPREGTLVGLDNLAIPREAPHVEAAYRFIDFLLRPDIAARNSKATRFASGVERARALVDRALANDRSVYPDEETIKHLFIVPAYDPHTLQGLLKLGFEWPPKPQPPKLPPKPVLHPGKPGKKLKRVPVSTKQ